MPPQSWLAISEQAVAPRPAWVGAVAGTKAGIGWDVLL